MKKITFFFLIIAITASVRCLVFSQEAPAEVIQAAENRLNYFLNKIPWDDRLLYGFKKDDILNDALLGSPFLLYTITPSAIKNYQTGDTVQSILAETEIWYFPVILNNSTKALLAVDKVNNQWEAVSLGYASLSQEISALQNRWSSGEGYHPKLIANFQAQKYFYTIPEKNQYNLTPIELHGWQLNRATTISPQDYSNIQDISNVIKSLKPIVDQY